LTKTQEEANVSYGNEITKGWKQRRDVRRKDERRQTMEGEEKSVDDKYE
jgi:hypothetical protein